MAGPLVNDRTQKFGRNLIFTARLILVLALVYEIKVRDLKTLWFVFKDNPDGIFTFWYLLAGILFYYFMRFSVDAWANYLDIRRDIKTCYTNLKTSNSSLKDEETRLEILNEGHNKERIQLSKDRIVNHKEGVPDLSSQRIQIWQFYML